MSENWEKNSQNGQPLEDRALKAAAQFMGEELLPLLGVKGKVKRIAPTEQVYLEIKGFNEDFNYEMMDGTWRHLEFESDSITVEDLRRFRAYEAVASYHYGVEVTTCVVCSSQVKELKSELQQGINHYQVQIIRLKNWNADEVIRVLEEKQKRNRLKRQELVQLLLVPLMDGRMSQSERISRGMKVLQKEKGHQRQEELMRMQAVLYALAMKFLKHTELEKLKEEMHMTYLGELLRQDGIEEGRREGRVNFIRLLRKKAEKKISVEDCADFLEEDIKLVRKVYEAIQKHPDWEDERIYEEMRAAGMWEV